MKILLTGGAGFICSNIVDGYIDAGYEVVIVDNLITGKTGNLNTRARFYLMDIRNDELSKVFEIERPDIVNHHAAQMSVPASVADPIFDADNNIIGLLNILNNCIKFDVKKFIFISSGGAVYGEAEKIPTPEDYRPMPLSPYAVTKFASEIYLNYFNNQFGLRYTVLRYSNVYGPRQVPHGEAGVVAIFMTLLKDGRLPVIFHYPESPDGMLRDYCFVRDIVMANIAAIDMGDNEIINIGSGITTSTGELYRTILSAMRERGLAADKVFDLPNKADARPGDIRRSCIDNSKALTVLNWRPSFTLKAGIKETLKYILDK